VYAVSSVSCAAGVACGKHDVRCGEMTASLPKDVKASLCRPMAPSTPSQVSLLAATATATLSHSHNEAVHRSCCPNVHQVACVGLHRPTSAPQIETGVVKSD
jgi:hypothetical protein